MTSARCWIKYQCLPNGMSTARNDTFGRMQNSSKSGEVKELFDLFVNLRIGVDASDPLHCVLEKEGSTDDM